ncbi:MAG: DUF4181 domain-containing protein [Clostridiaceae bacterium]|nr:DUF4181 domain-containing protein [Clostridiaceae bacterium]
MDMLTIKFVVLFTISLAGFVVYIDMLDKTKSRFNIKEEKGLWYKSVNKVHKWSQIAIIVIMIFILYLTIFVYQKQLKMYCFMIYPIILTSFRAFMEWKYEEESNRYRINILDSSFLLLQFVVLGLASLWF